MSTVRTLLPALGAGFVFTLGGTGEKIVFQPEAGASVTKTFTLGGEYSLDDLSLIVNGEDVGGMIGSIEVSAKQESKIEVTDVYKAVAEGRPTELLRTFDALSNSMHMSVSPAEAEMPEMTSSSALEGKTVAFKWNAEKGEYERSYHESEGDAALLEKLEEDMDLRVFLPEAEVGEKDTWSIELARLDRIVMPGGDMSLRPEGMEIDEESVAMFEEFFSGFGDKFGDLLEGECTCTYKGARDEDGVRVAEIAIDLEVATTLDLTEFLDQVIQAALDKSGAGEMVEFSLDSADLNLDFEGKGTLLWDLKAGRAHSFELSGEATIGMEFAVSVEVEGQSQGVDASLELSGSMREELAVK